MSGKPKRGTSGTFTVHFDVSEGVFHVLTKIAYETRQNPNEVASVIVHDWLNTIAKNSCGDPKLTRNAEIITPNGVNR